MIATILIFLLIFFAIVMGHEFGHFLLAKANGIRVNEFAIGMGPKIAHFQKGETDYVLRALPIGGACMFEGEDGLESENGRIQEGNFQNASVWARISTVAAGPIFNFLLAFVFAVIVAGYAGADLPILGGVTQGSAAEAAGMQAGDRITRFNGKVHLAREIALEMALNPDGEPVEVEYVRDGESYRTTLTPAYSKEQGRYLVGFENYSYPVAAKGFQLFEYGWYQLRFSIKNSVMSVAALIQGNLTADDVAGPVGMVQIVDEVREETAPGGPLLVFMNMVNLAMLLSVSLGVMNLLPLPALDGGRLIFLLLEVIRGKPIPPEKEGIIHFAGFVALMILMIFVMFNDIQRIVG